MREVAFNQIPEQEFKRIRERLTQQINQMNAADLYILSQSEKDLADFIVEAFAAVARLFGYIVSIPLRIAREIGKGFMEGFRTGMNK